MNGYYLKLLTELSVDNTLAQRELSRRVGMRLSRVSNVLSTDIDGAVVRAKRF